MALRGRVALITGSTSGIGLGIARVLAGKGADIMLNGLENAAAVADVMASLKATNPGISIAHSGADLSDSEQVEEMVNSVPGLFGGRSADILVNNAGIQHVAPVEAFPLSAWRRVLDINLTSNFVAIQAALPAMQAAQWGRIINVASVHGRVGSVHKSAYVASKHGVVGLTKVVALEAAGSGVTCNAVCPGWVLTPLVQAQIDAKAAAAGSSVEEATRNLLAEKQPSGAFATPGDIGELTAFLCSNAAAQITGEDIAIDGGWTAR